MLFRSGRDVFLLHGYAVMRLGHFQPDSGVSARWVARVKSVPAVSASGQAATLSRRDSTDHGGVGLVWRLGCIDCNGAYVGDAGILVGGFADCIDVFISLWK